MSQILLPAGDICSVRHDISCFCTIRRGAACWSRYSDYVTGWSIRGLNPGRDKIFLLKKCPDRISGVKILLFSGYCWSSPRVKWLRRSGNHSPPSCDEVMNEWSYTYTPRACLNNVDRNKFIFCLYNRT
jgi:hypothetical protein